MEAPEAESPMEFPKPQEVRMKKSVVLTQLSKGYELVFKGLTIKVDKKEILSNVSGIAKPGEMVAIMGPSGAGKSTLLNAIAGRLTLDSGSVTLNSHPLTKQLRRKISYVLQDDTFLTQLTFWDTIWFTALLRLPGSMPTKDKKKRVDEIIEALDMKKCCNTIIGDPTNRGLSGGEKKRANIACELLTNPALMLLDEPTSGLDSATAYSLMSTLKKFAKKSGKTVVATIHQPSSQIFNMFDRLLLLCDGKVAYSGSVQNCASHFQSVGLMCQAHYNLADFILDAVKESDPETKIKIFERAEQQKYAADYPWQLKDKKQQELSVIESNNDDNNNNSNYNNSSNNVESEAPPPYSQDHTGHINGAFNASTESVHIQMEEDEDDILDADVLKYRKEYEDKWPTSFWIQFNVLTRRSFKQAWPVILSKGNIIQSLIIAVFVGLIWYQTKAVEESLQDRVGLLFFVQTRIVLLTQINGVRSFPTERPVLNKERLAGYYRLSAYYLAKTTSELPLILLMPSLFSTIVYWMAGLNNDFLTYLQTLGVMLLAAITSQSLGFFFGALILDQTLAFLTATTTILCVMLAGGFYVQDIPVWAAWIQYLAFGQYTYYSLLNIQFTNTDIKCAVNGSRFCYDIPINSTAEQIPDIPRKLLLDFYTSAGDGWQLWHYICCILFIILLMRVLTYIVLRFIRKPPSAKS